MAIEVNDKFLQDVIAKNMDIAGAAPSSPASTPNGEIDSMIIRPGHQNFASGQRAAALIRQNGSEVKQRLVEIGGTAGQRAQQLRQFISMTNDAEHLNSMSAQEFFSKLPTWSTGGSGGGGGGGGGHGPA
jgi:hypothetical protein